MSKYCNSASGKKYRLFRNTTAPATPTWVEITEAQDIDFGFAPDSVETPQRSSDYKLYDHGQIEASISFAMTKRTGSVNITHFYEATTEDCAWEYYLCDGDVNVTGTYVGVRGGFKAFDASATYPLNDQATMAIELKPSYFEDTGAPGVEIPVDPTHTIVTP